MAKSLLDIPVKMCVAVNSLLSSTSFLAFKRSATSIFCCPKPSVLPPHCPWHQNFWRLPCAKGQLAILLQCWYRARSLSTIMAGHIARCGKASWRCMLFWHGLLDMINSLHRNTPLSMKAACSIRITWICPHWFVIISFRCWSITDAENHTYTTRRTIVRWSTINIASHIHMIYQRQTIIRPMKRSARFSCFQNTGWGPKNRTWEDQKDSAQWIHPQVMTSTGKERKLYKSTSYRPIWWFDCSIL